MVARRSATAYKPYTLDPYIPSSRGSFPAETWCDKTGVHNVVHGCGYYGIRPCQAMSMVILHTKLHPKPKTTQVHHRRKRQEGLVPVSQAHAGHARLMVSRAGVQVLANSYYCTYSDSSLGRALRLTLPQALSFLQGA